MYLKNPMCVLHKYHQRKITLDTKNGQGRLFKTNRE